MQKQLSYLENLSGFSLVRYEPNDIILLNKGSRLPYQYHQLNQQINLLPDISHPYLLRPILCNNGALYPKGDSNLAIQLETRMRAYNPIHFSAQQLCNTFSPIIECIDFLHQKGIVHGTISTESILFFENGEIILKDWIFKSNKKPVYAGNTSQLSKSDDLIALGKLLVQAACLRGPQQIEAMSLQEICEKILEFYEPSFCYGLLILIKGLYKQLPSVLSLLSGDQKTIKEQQLLKIVQKAQKNKQQKEKLLQRKAQQEIALAKKKQSEIQKQSSKIQFTPKKQPIGESNASNISMNTSMQGSPTKKFNITANKKFMKLEDGENKKSYNDDVKKKQIQKITKIIQRSNAFVNELMARKNNDKKLMQGSKIGHLHSTSLYDSYGLENSGTSKKYPKQSPKLASPSKRLRSISKKK